MEEIEVGEYVRTNKGNIGQVIGIFNGHCQAKYHIQFQGRVKVKRQYLSTHTIINHSKQLIDLIEVGDIVEIRIGLYSSFKCFVENEDNLLLLEEKVKQFCNIEKILTKEQFEANCYKIRGKKKI